MTHPTLDNPAMDVGRPAVRKQLGKSLVMPSRLYAYGQVTSNLGAMAVVLLLAMAADQWWQLLLAYVVIGLVQHRLFFPIHDCIHYSLFPTKAENRMVGALLSAMLGTSFDAIRGQHLQHHRDFGKPVDPGASDYFVRFKSRREFVFFLLAPLAGSIFFRKVGDYISRPSQTTSAIVDRRSQGDDSLVVKIRPYLLILVVQLCIMALLTRGFQTSAIWRYPILYFAPLMTVFLFLIRLRMFLEHGSLDYGVCDYFEQKRPTSRTIIASRIERILLCGSGFNFHHEHHLYPAVPGRNLPALHKELSPDLAADDSRETYFQALCEIWFHLAPKVGTT